MLEHDNYYYKKHVSREETSRVEIIGFDISWLPIEVRILYYNFLLENQKDRLISISSSEIVKDIVF